MILDKLLYGVSPTKESKSSKKLIMEYNKKIDSQEDLAMHILNEIKNLGTSEMFTIELESVPGYTFEVKKKKI